MDAVVGHQQRDAQTGVQSTGDAVVDEVVVGVQDRADRDGVEHRVRIGEDRQLGHLTHLLGRRHPRQQVGDALVDRKGGVQVGGMLDDAHCFLPGCCGVVGDDRAVGESEDCEGENVTPVILAQSECL